MKRTICAAVVLPAGILVFTASAWATLNTPTAAEAAGLPGITASRPALTDSLPERTTLDPAALAAKPPKIRKDDAAPAAAPGESKNSNLVEGQKKAK